MASEEEADLRTYRWQLRQLLAQRDDLDLAIRSAERMVERGRLALHEARLSQNASRLGFDLLARAVQSRSMGTAQSPALTISDADRKAALAAIAKAGKTYRFVGIRPRGLKQTAPAAVLISATVSEPELIMELGVALGKASIAWPGHTEFEVIGADSFKERAAGDQMPTAASGMPVDARLMGSFDVETRTAQAGTA